MHLRTIPAQRPERRAAKPSRIDQSAVGRVGYCQIHGTPRAVCFPRDDGAFATRVQALLPDDCDSEEPFGPAVLALLRETYPLAAVRPRHELGALDGAPVWYAFRDGAVVPAAKEDTS